MFTHYWKMNRIETTKKEQAYMLSKFVQGDPKQMSLSAFELESVLDAGFNFSACVLESESRARFISPL